MATCNDDGPFTLDDCNCDCGVELPDPTPLCPTTEDAVYNGPIMVTLSSFSRLRSCLMFGNIGTATRFSDICTMCSYISNGRTNNVGPPIDVVGCTFEFFELCGENREECSSYSGAYIIQPPDSSPDVQVTEWGSSGFGGTGQSVQNPAPNGVFYLGDQLAISIRFSLENLNSNLQGENCKQPIPQMTVNWKQPIGMYGGSFVPPLGVCDKFDIDPYLELCQNIYDNLDNTPNIALFTPEDPINNSLHCFNEGVTYGGSGLENNTPEQGKTITLFRQTIGLPTEMQVALLANNPEEVFCLHGGPCPGCRFFINRKGASIPVCMPPDTATITFL